jgi:hypothetical protein
MRSSSEGLEKKTGHQANNPKNKGLNTFRRKKNENTKNS